MMHSVFINNKTQSNETFTFEEFYEVISQFQAKNHWLNWLSWLIY